MSSGWKQNEIVIVGAGLAGLFTALKLSPLPVTIVTSAPLGMGGSSVWAQAGIAAALEEGDTPDAHTQDTMQAGAGIVNPQIADILSSEAKARIEDLLKYGTPFDQSEGGDFLLSKEAAHSARRVVRVKGDRAGRAIMQALITMVRTQPHIQVIEGYSAKKLAMDKGSVQGVHSWSLTGKHLFLPARALIIAAGGTGFLYKTTTNPAQSNGEALAMAAKAGAVLADMEFVQFHPTAIVTDFDPAPLATEALRGEGAILIDQDGRRFMTKIHKDAELAPRDIVARAVFRQNKGKGQVFLDCREAIGDEFEAHFPSVYEKCMDAGIDPVTEPIPINPAAHFHMGGILTDAFGRTSLNGLWACGEVTSTGAHGANRLASNSLLEAVVFAARVANDLKSNTHLSQGSTSLDETASNCSPQVETKLTAQQDKDLMVLRHAMDRHVGIERNKTGLLKTLKLLQKLAEKHQKNLTFSNMLTTAQIITVSALAREESRGGHYRSDFPKKNQNWEHRSKISLDQALDAIEQFLN